MRRMFLSVTTLLGLVLFAFVVFVLAMRTARRRGAASSSATPLDTDFSLEELHRLHRSGQLSAEEFERTKTVVLTRQAALPQTLQRSTPPTKRGFEVLPPGEAMSQPRPAAGDEGRS
jgi:hypothetical protein